MTKNRPRILFLDLETAPNEGYFWDLWIPGGYLRSENITREKYIIGAAWKWMGKKEVYTKYIDPKDPHNDYNVAKELRNVLSQADVVVAHNLNKFDMRWIRTRIMYHNLSPIPKIIQYDTRLLAKRYFNLNSTSLDYLARYFNIGHKLKTEYELWKKCIKGDVKALDKMRRYNIWDVILLQKVFNRMSSHLPPLINMRLFNGKTVCKHCGSKDIQYRGFYYANTRKYRRYICKSCGVWDHENKAEKL